jgi:hypothetical protein
MMKFDQLTEVSSDERKIWWLASYPKSGNTWVRMFINAYATKFPININSVYQYVTSDLRPEIFQMMCPRPITEFTLLEQFMYHPGALLNLLKISNTKDIVVKTHNAKATVNGFILIPPDISAGAIYIIRDPRDIVISHASHFDKTIDESITDLNNINRAGLSKQGLYHLFMSWSNHVSSWTVENKNINTTIVKYEDMLMHPKKAFECIIEALEIETEDHEERFNHALNETRFEKLQAYEKNNGFIENTGEGLFFRKGATGQWKRHLSKKQIDKINSQHKVMMQQYGYL